MKNIVRFPSFRLRQGEIQDQAAQWIILFDQKKPTKDEFKDFLRWYRQDKQHRDAFKRLAQTWNLAVHLPDMDSTPKQRAAQSRWLPLGVAAAVTAIGIAITVSFGTLSAPTYTEQLATNATERTTHALIDGSEILLDTNTQINIRFDNERRITELQRGQAHFTVNKDPKRPFRVETPLGSVTALGTAFTVDMEKDQLDVLVTEGIVEVRSPFKNKPIYLEAGYQYIISSLGTKKTRLSHEAMMNQSAWQQGMLIFTGESLASVMNAMGRYHDIEFSFDKPEIAAMRIGGTFAADNLNGLLESLNAGFDLSYRYEANGKRLVLYNSKS